MTLNKINKNMIDPDFVQQVNDTTAQLAETNQELTTVQNDKADLTEIHRIESELLEKAPRPLVDMLASKDYVDSQISSVNTGGNIDLSRKADATIIGYLSPNDFEIGTLDSVGGAPVEQSTRMRSKDFIRVSRGTVIKNIDETNLKIGVHFFTLNKIWERIVGFSANMNTHFIENDCYIKIVAAYKNDRGITDIADIVSKLVIYGAFTNINKKVLEMGDAVKEMDDVVKIIEQKVESIELKDIKTNNTGRELLFKFNIPNNYMSDHTFVGDELWFFEASNDAHTDWAKVRRYSINLENKTATLLGTFDHNWGHCNTVTYSKQTDTLILGNGGGSDNIQPDEIYIFENASQMMNQTQVDVVTAIRLRLNNDGFEWGKQINVVWGESNAGKHNIAYVISNNDVTQFIHKIILGQGGNQLEKGTFISGKTGRQFNGTYKVLNQYTYPYPADRYYANQGSIFYNGVLYEGFGHEGLSHIEKILNTDGTVTAKIMQERIYDDLGNEIASITNGLTVNDGALYIGNVNNPMAVCEVYVFKFV